MNIQPAQWKDGDSIFSLMSKLGRIAYTKDLILDLIDSDESLSLVAIEDDKIVGAIGARGEGKNGLWLYYVVVDPEYQSNGVGSELMEQLFTMAREKGIKRAALDTPDGDFFSRYKFKEIGRIPNWYEDRDQIIMYREL